MPLRVVDLRVPPRPATWVKDRVGRQFHLRYDAPTRALHLVFDAAPLPRFGRAFLEEILEAQRGLTASDGWMDAGMTERLEVVVVRSVGSVFSMGGDLDFFVGAITAQDRQALLDYALLCVEVVYRNHRSYEIPVTTVSLVEGNAFGGGMEAALSSDVVIAERGVKWALPEATFGLFPGMGAFNFLARRVGPARARSMILSGDFWTSAQLHDMGVVDVVADDGEGKAALARHLDDRRRRRQHGPAIAMQRVMNASMPVTLQDLNEVAGIWVEAALALPARDVERMRRIARGQRRSFAPAMSETDAP